MTSRVPIGTLVNVGSVVIGSLIGLSLRSTFPEGIKEIVFQAIGLATILIGIKMLLRLPDGYMLIFIFSMILGGIIGEAIGLDGIIRGLSDQLKDGIGSTESQFSDGLITAFVLFCIGSMTFVGSIEEGLNGDRELLYTKSLLDGFSSIALSASFGIGVLFSVIPMLILQGGITLSARAVSQYINDDLLHALSAVGGALILGITIMMLELGEIRLNSLLPALLVVILMTSIYQRYTIKEA